MKYKIESMIRIRNTYDSFSLRLKKKKRNRKGKICQVAKKVH